MNAACRLDLPAFWGLREGQFSAKQLAGFAKARAALAAKRQAAATPAPANP
jgi:hypothetical protein